MITKGQPAVFIYRGQLGIERSRIEFLLDVAIQAFGSIEIIHLFPGRNGSLSMWDHFTRPRQGIESVRLLDARVSRVRAIRRALSWIRPSGRPVFAVGFSVAAFLPNRRCDIWCINGIPEERLLTRDTAVSRGLVRLSWATARRINAKLVVTVSQPMSTLMRSRLPSTRVIEVPNTVDTKIFHPRIDDERPYVTYLGGASPWQGLERLGEVWVAMYELDDSLRFRVISQDSRASILGKGLPTHAVESVSTQDPSVVAEWMSQAKVAFLFRAPGLVNQVSWPMEFGEYIAAGVPCAVSRVGWDLESVVERFRVGVVVNWHDDPKATAATVLQYLGDGPSRGQADFVGATEYLKHESWVVTTAQALREVLPK